MATLKRPTLALSLPAVFGDNMILQRDINIPIWGNASKSHKGKTIQVSLAGQSATGTIDAQGQWRVTFPPQSAGGPYDLHISIQSSNTELTFINVAIGDVWLASGQSNMQWSVSNSDNADEEIANANYPNIRLFKVPNVATLRKNPPIVSAWKKATPNTVSIFSAVAYFFARDIHQQTGIPIGIINSSWGGTYAEAWTSAAALNSDPTFKKIISAYDKSLKSPNGEAKRNAKAMSTWQKKHGNADTKNRGEGKGWHKASHSIDSWKTMPLPNNWQSQGHRYSGIFWFCRDVDVPKAHCQHDLTLCLGAIDKADITYVNGKAIGSLTMEDTPEAWCTPREYNVPKALLKPGKNRIAVRAYSNIFQGGLIGPALQMKLVNSKNKSSAGIPLAGDWRYNIEANFGEVPPPPTPPQGEGNPNSPHILYDSMIAPLIPFAIKGAIWYQGESNAARANSYRTLFPLMINDWRNAWQQGAFPFYFVQLANFTVPNPEMPKHAWADLREAQRNTLALTNTGMACAIDIGNPNDIHPANKQDVGKRLARHALANDYGFTGLVKAGPTITSANKVGRKIILSYSEVGGGLKQRAAKLVGFEISATGKTWQKVTATLQNNEIHLSMGKLKTAKWVRYNWENNPDTVLYNASDLPAVPCKITVS